MSGFVALGYDVRDRRVVVNDREAERLRYTFKWYLELGSVRLLKAKNIIPIKTLPRKAFRHVWRFGIGESK